MTEMTVTEFSRNLGSVFDRIEFNNEEIILIRNRHPIARIIPGPVRMTAIEAMSDLFGTLPDSSAEGWVDESRLQDRVAEDKNPWDI